MIVCNWATKCLRAIEMRAVCLASASPTKGEEAPVRRLLVPRTQRGVSAESEGRTPPTWAVQTGLRRLQRDDVWSDQTPAYVPRNAVSRSPTACTCHGIPVATQ